MQNNPNKTNIKNNMKLKSLTLSALSLLAMLGSSARADITIHVTAATYYRSAVTNAIVHLLSQGGGTVKVAYVGSNLAGSSSAVFQGSVPSSSSPSLNALGVITVEASYAGSITSLASLVEPATIKLTYPTAAAITTGVATASSQTITSNFGLLPGATANVSGITLTGSDSETASSDVAIGDVYQSSTPFSASNGYPAVTDQLVGVSPYTWVKGAALTTDADYTSGGYGRLTNLTSLQAKYLFASGYGVAVDFTGNTSDTYYVNLIGRDYDSGTRFDTIAEAELPGTYPITQFPSLKTNGGTLTPNSTITDNSNTEVTSALSTALPATGGYSSGGTLATALEVPGSDGTNDFGGYLVGYLGASDADTALNVTGGPSGYLAPKALTYNGVALSKTNVLNGTYSFWTYDHFQTVPSRLSTNTQTFLTALASQLTTTDTQVAGYRLSDLKVSRSVEGGVITLQ